MTDDYSKVREVCTELYDDIASKFPPGRVTRITVVPPKTITIEIAGGPRG